MVPVTEAGDKLADALIALIFGKADANEGQKIRDTISARFEEADKYAQSPTRQT